MYDDKKFRKQIRILKGICFTGFAAIVGAIISFLAMKKTGLQAVFWAGRFLALAAMTIFIALVYWNRIDYGNKKK
ncbi:MAG: hypothetical protein ACI4LM_03420 [Anaerovoracaceae bacterium]|jgi:uncharacterized membrane protein YdbT with pleckstrin-like domain